MSTVRRLYFYTLSLISFEVVIWGVISLLRTVLSNRLVGGGSLLATGLSLVLVGLPIFWLHWRTVQRDALRDPDEQASRVRAVFFYAALFGLMMPIVYAVMAVINRQLVLFLGQDVTRAWLGGQGSNLDNLLAILINLVGLAYFFSALRADWQAGTPVGNLADARRLFRYLWLVFGLTLTVSGVFNLLRYLFEMAGQDSGQIAPILAGGLTLLVIGVPIWYIYASTIQSSLSDPAERRSLLRLFVLYLISLAGVVGVLTSAGGVLNSLIRWVLGEAHNPGSFLNENSAYLGAVVPLGVMWWYYGNMLNREVAALPDQPRRAALSRLYGYILAGLGLAVTYVGLINLVEFLAEVVFAGIQLVGSYRDTLSGAISALLVGLPLWLMNWQAMQREAARKDDAGDHARRSVLRRVYLYLALFLLVIGGMGYTGQLLYTLLNAVLAVSTENVAWEAARLFLSLVVDLLLLIYHWRALREDGRLAQQTLGKLHAGFPTLVLVENGTGETSSHYGTDLVQALGRIAPKLPVAIHLVDRGAPDEAMLGAKAVLIPVGLALNPPDSLKLWLAEYTGRKILVPLPSAGWGWLGQVDKQPQDLAREAAQTIRQMAEGETVRQALPSSPWAVAGFVLGGIFGLILLFLLFSLLLSSLVR